MDTLYWNNLSVGIKFKETKKQFWGRYLWRMEIQANCADVAFHDDPQRSVKILKAHDSNKKTGLGAMDCKWHPTLPWIFTCGNEGNIKLWV